MYDGGDLVLSVFGTNCHLL